MLTSAAAISIQVGADYVHQKLVAFLSQVLPPGTEDAVLQQFRYRGQRPAALIVVAAMLSLWAASSVIKSLMDGFNAAYHVPRNRSMWAHIGVGIMLVFLIVIPMVGASSLILFGGTVEHGIMKLWKVDPILNPRSPSLLHYYLARYAT